MSRSLYCLVSSCHENGTQGFFSLPNDKEEARKWLDSIKADHSNLLRKTVRICYKHFHKEQLKLDGKYYKVKKGNVFKSAESIENSSDLTHRI